MRNDLPQTQQIDFITFKIYNKIRLYTEDKIMKVLIINGSPRKDGNTSIAVAEMEKVFKSLNVESQNNIILYDEYRKKKNW